MSSRFRAELCLVLCALLLCGGCERERREYQNAPASDARPRLTAFQPGAALGEEPDAVGAHYRRNAYHISQGGLLYRRFNCNGCHANGGGAIGPALMDEAWRYGGSIAQVHASIVDGRPNGMPAWRGKLTDTQAWQLSAYVLSLSANVPKDARPGRGETMSSGPPPSQRKTQPRRGTDPASLQAPSP